MFIHTILCVCVFARRFLPRNMQRKAAIHFYSISGESISINFWNHHKFCKLFKLFIVVFFILTLEMLIDAHKMGCFCMLHASAVWMAIRLSSKYVSEVKQIESFSNWDSFFANYAQLYNKAAIHFGDAKTSRKKKHNSNIQKWFWYIQAMEPW